jgi:hypothetical protein
MKKHLLSTLFLGSSLLLISSSCTKKEEAAPVSTTIDTSLMAHYTFDGDANDKSGNNHDASVYGAVQTSDRKGVSKGAYFFDGFDDYMKVTNTTGLNNENLTYSAWIKPVAQPTSSFYASLISIGNIAGDQAVTINNNYHSTVGINVGGYNKTTTTSATSVNNNQLPALNEWVLVTYTRSNTEIKLYLNGVQKASVSTEGNLPKYSTPLVFTIGTRFNLEAFFQGAIDEVKIYNRVLTPTEIQQLYNQ